MRKTKIILALFVVVLGLVVAGAIRTESSAKGKMKISHKKITVRIGEKKTIRIKNATKEVRWSVGNWSIARCQRSGKGKKSSKLVINGNDIGTVKMVAKCGGKKFKCTIKVIHSKEHENLVRENALNENWPKNGVSYDMVIHETKDSKRSGYFKQENNCDGSVTPTMSIMISYMKSDKMKLSWSNDKKYTVVSYKKNSCTPVYAVTLDGPDKRGTKAVMKKYVGAKNQQFLLVKTGRKFNGHTTFFLITPKGNFVSMFGLKDDAALASEYWFE